MYTSLITIQQDTITDKGSREERLIMKRFVMLCAIAISLSVRASSQPGISYAAGEVLLKFKDPTQFKFTSVDGGFISGIPSLDNYLQALEVTEIKDVFSPQSVLRGYYHVTFPQDVDVMEICRTLRLVGGIEFATPNHYGRASSDPNDPLWPQQWQALKQQFREAGDISRGSSTVLIGVIDTGLDISHPDISSNAAPSFHNDYVDDDFDPSEEPPSDHGTRGGGDHICPCQQWYWSGRLCRRLGNRPGLSDCGPASWFI